MQAKAPLQFSEERANENPLERWTRVLVEEANAQARKALEKTFAALNHAGKAAFSAFKGEAPSADVRLRSGNKTFKLYACHRGMIIRMILYLDVGFVADMLRTPTGKRSCLHGPV